MIEGYVTRLLLNGSSRVKQESKQTTDVAKYSDSDKRDFETSLTNSLSRNG